MAGKLCAGRPATTGLQLKESKAYCEGQKARVDDALFSDNPHDPNSDAGKSWSVGWFIVDQQAPITLSEAIGCCAAMGTVGGVPTEVAPIWEDPINVEMQQGDPYPITNLSDFILLGSAPITYTIDTGALPPGISLLGDGTFTGTATNVAGGSTGYLATNAAGAAASGFFKYTVSS